MYRLALYLYCSVVNHNVIGVQVLALDVSSLPRRHPFWLIECLVCLSVCVCVSGVGAAEGPGRCRGVTN